MRELYASDCIKMIDINCYDRMHNIERDNIRIARRNKRENSVAITKRAIIMITAFIAAVIICSIVCGEFNVSANDVGNSQPVKFFKTYTVESGDSLYGIAYNNMPSEYDDVEEYISEIIHINQLTSDIIEPGWQLMIPYYDLPDNF